MLKKYANAIESRLDDSDCTLESTIEENEYNFKMCNEYGCDYILIDSEYKPDIELINIPSKITPVN